MPPPDTETTTRGLQGSSQTATSMISLGTFNLRQDIGNNTFVLNRASNDDLRAPDAAQATHAPALQPVQDTERLYGYFDRFFTNVAAVSTLGSSITFALIVSQLQDPLSGVEKKKVFDLSAVRILIATGWLLFTTTLILSFFLSGMLKWWHSRPGSSANDGFWFLGLLYILMAGAFFCLSLAVAAYVEVVGVLACVIIGLICVLPLILFAIALIWDCVGLIGFLVPIYLTAGPLRG